MSISISNIYLLINYHHILNYDYYSNPSNSINILDMLYYSNLYLLFIIINPYNHHYHNHQNSLLLDYIYLSNINFIK